MKEAIDIISFFGYDTDKVGIDMWYDDSIEDCDNFSWSFYDCDPYEYRGNLYKQGKVVGDFHSPTLQDFTEVWNKAHPQK